VDDCDQTRTGERVHPDLVLKLLWKIEEECKSYQRSRCDGGGRVGGDVGGVGGSCV
jgi:hypothetical protein